MQYAEDQQGIAERNMREEPQPQCGLQRILVIEHVLSGDEVPQLVKHFTLAPPGISLHLIKLGDMCGLRSA